MCDHPGVTPGTPSAAIKHPFFGTWTSETTATVMAKRYRLWPCRNRPREGPENLAKIETRAMGFLATPKARSARSLASASTPAFRHRISHDRDAAAAATRVPGTPSLAGGPRCRRGRLRIQAAPGERPSTRRCAAARDRHHRERNLPISGPAGALRVIFHTVAAHAPPGASYGVLRDNHREVLSTDRYDPGKFSTLLRVTFAALVFAVTGHLRP